MYNDLSLLIYQVEWARQAEDIQNLNKQIAEIFIGLKDLGIVTAEDIGFIFDESERLCRVINAIRAITARSGSGKTFLSSAEYEFAQRLAINLNTGQRECLGQYNDSYCKDIESMVRSAWEA